MSGPTAVPGPTTLDGEMANQTMLVVMRLVSITYLENGLTKTVTSPSSLSAAFLYVHANADLVDCPTQLTLVTWICQCVPQQIPVRNMKEHSREIC